MELGNPRQENMQQSVIPSFVQETCRSRCFNLALVARRAIKLSVCLSQTCPSRGPPSHMFIFCGPPNTLNNEQNNRRLTHERNVLVICSRQCTCKVLAENSVGSVDYYITKVVLLHHEGGTITSRRWYYSITKVVLLHHEGGTITSRRWYYYITKVVLLHHEGGTGLTALGLEVHVRLQLWCDYAE